MEPYALVVGESLVDVVTTPDGRTVERPGGSAANVAVALARLGRPVRFATAYAEDARGQMVAAHLSAAGVELASDPRVLDRTSSAAATIGADGAASYVFDLEWRLSVVALEPPPAFVHVCSIGAVVEPGADAVLAVLDACPSAIVTYDINARPAITGVGPEVVARVEAVVARSALVKASDEDLAALYPGLTVEAAVAHLLALGPRAVVVTMGGAGAEWHQVDAVFRGLPVLVTVVDTIGAGDTFSAAIIDARWEGLDPLATLEHAAHAASITVSRAGADPPTRAELGRVGPPTVGGPT